MYSTKKIQLSKRQESNRDCLIPNYFSKRKDTEGNFSMYHVIWSIRNTTLA